jgi:hypothetical protein
MQAAVGLSGAGELAGGLRNGLVSGLGLFYFFYSINRNLGTEVVALPTSVKPKRPPPFKLL